MSMQINKILGYGVHGKTHGVKQHEMSEKIYENSIEDEVAALVDAEIEKKSNLWDTNLLYQQLILRKTQYPKYFRDVVHYAEFTDSDNGWWVIMPPSNFKSWFRHDNSIDYYEAFLGDQMQTVVKEINIPLYPYGMWMDKNTGIILKNYITQDENTNAVPHVPQVVKIIAENLGFPDWKLFRPVMVQWWS